MFNWPVELVIQIASYNQLWSIKLHLLVYRWIRASFLCGSMSYSGFRWHHSPDVSLRCMLSKVLCLLVSTSNTLDISSSWRQRVPEISRNASPRWRLTLDWHIKSASLKLTWVFVHSERITHISHCSNDWGAPKVVARTEIRDSQSYAWQIEVQYLRHYLMQARNSLRLANIVANLSLLWEKELCFPLAHTTASIIHRLFSWYLLNSSGG